MRYRAPQSGLFFGMLAAAGGFAFTILAFFPGFMSADSLAQYESSKSFEYTDWHPPVMAWLWSLLNQVSDGPQGMLVWHLFLLWSALFLLYAHAFPISRNAWAFFAVGFLPWLLNFAGVVWKDVGTAFALALAVGLGLSKPRPVSIGLSAVMLFYALCLRYNALFALPPLLIFFWSRWSPRASRLKILFLSVVTLGFMLLATNLVNYSLLKARKTSPSSYMMVDDLAYLSLRSEKSLLPGIEYRDIQKCALREIGQNRLVGRSFCLAEGRDFAKGNPLNTPDMGKIWLAQVFSHPLEYARFRLAAFAYLLRSSQEAPYYIWHPGIDPNSLGLSQTDSKLTQFVRGWVNSSAKFAPEMFKPFTWLIVGVLVAAAGLLQARSNTSNAAVALSTSSLFYILGYVPATPMADFRYVYWSVVATSIAAVLLLIMPRGRRSDSVLAWAPWLALSAALWLVHANAERIFDLKIDRLVWRQLSNQAHSAGNVSRISGFEALPNNFYHPTNEDPQLTWDIAAPGIPTSDLQYLAFDFRCDGQTASPRVQIFWWLSSQSVALEEQSTTINAVRGTNVISTKFPAQWHKTDYITHLRLDLDPSDACQTVQLRNLAWSKQSD